MILEAVFLEIISSTVYLNFHFAIMSSNNNFDVGSSLSDINFMNEISNTFWIAFIIPNPMVNFSIVSFKATLNWWFDFWIIKYITLESRNIATKVIIISKWLTLRSFYFKFLWVDAMFLNGIVGWHRFVVVVAAFELGVSWVLLLEFFVLFGKNVHIWRVELFLNCFLICWFHF